MWGSLVQKIDDWGGCLTRIEGGEDRSDRYLSSILHEPWKPIGGDHLSRQKAIQARLQLVQIVSCDLLFTRPFSCPVVQGPCMHAAMEVSSKLK